MLMNKFKLSVLAIIVIGFAFYLVTPYAKQSTPFPLPQFTQSSEESWINSSPLVVHRQLRPQAHLGLCPELPGVVYPHLMWSDNVR